MRHANALARGDAVASEITNEGWRDGLGHSEVPLIDARTAGRNLARIAGNHDLTLFAHYSTDYAGHRKSLPAASAALRLVDEFLGGLTEMLDDDVLLFVASDHGNLEDASTGHTLNPALGLIVGRGHLDFRSLSAITGVAPALLNALRA